mmetsp:Transcript_46894/g.93354  ORF Transcript_46894/g.93354 Transcript_46894/m.93354 type:complete len:96 (+) Transcript_46894:203-490(+)
MRCIVGSITAVLGAKTDSATRLPKQAEFPTKMQPWLLQTPLRQYPADNRHLHEQVSTAVIVSGQSTWADWIAGCAAEHDVASQQLEGSPKADVSN